MSSFSIGTLASSIARGSELESAVRNALHCATHSVQHTGAQKSYAFLADVPKEFHPPQRSAVAFDKKIALQLLSDEASRSL
jgi:hypothetical protein